MIYCPKCECECSEEAVACPRCGHRLGSKVPATERQAAGAMGWIKAMCVLSEIAVITGLFFAILWFAGLVVSRSPDAVNDMWPWVAWFGRMAILGIIGRALAGIWYAVERIARQRP